MDFANSSSQAATRFIRQKIEGEQFPLTDGRLGWTLRGLLAIYANQTADEMESETTKEDNGIGFNGVDAKFLTAMAKQVVNWRDGNSEYRYPLSKKQFEATQKAMNKYSGQLAKLAKAKASATVAA